MAPSIQQLAEDISWVTVDPLKLAEARKETPQEGEKENPKEEPVAKVREEGKDAQDAQEAKPYVKRQIDIEGGTTTASVHPPVRFLFIAN